MNNYDDTSYPLTMFIFSICVILGACVILGTILFVMQSYGMVKLW